MIPKLRRFSTKVMLIMIFYGPSWLLSILHVAPVFNLAILSIDDERDVIGNRRLHWEICLPIDERFKIQSKLNELPRDSSKIRIRNRCELTGRTRGVYRKFKLSRIKIRELSMSGALPGVVKSSW